MQRTMEMEKIIHLSLDRISNSSRDLRYINYTVKKDIVFPVPSRDITTKLSLAGNNLIIPGQGEFDY